MLASVEERNKIASRDNMKLSPFKGLDAQGVLHAILESCLEFEPLFSAYDAERSHHDAFAAEISYIVSTSARAAKVCPRPAVANAFFFSPAKLPRTIINTTNRWAK